MVKLMNMLTEFVFVNISHLARVVLNMYVGLKVWNKKV